jgi:hypothetical protein
MKVACDVPMGKAERISVLSYLTREFAIADFQW